MLLLQALAPTTGPHPAAAVMFTCVLYCPQVYSAGVEMRRRDFLEGHWAPYLVRATSLTVNYRWVNRERGRWGGYGGLICVRPAHTI
jgi:hypothetical protein